MAINLTGKDKIKIKNDLVIDGDVVINGGLDAEETTVSVYRLNTATSVNVGTNLNVDENINVSGDIKINGESVVKHLYAHRIDFGEFYDGVDTGYLCIETIYSTSATPFTWTTPPPPPPCPRITAPPSIRSTFPRKGKWSSAPTPSAC